VDGVAFHYDSLPPGNKDDADLATHKMSILLGKQLQFIQLDDSPLQENGSDCGVFVCLNMRHLLLKRLLMVRSDEKVSMSMGGRRVDAREGRKEISRIIESYRREGERRRS
jgi:Ulp1 family protease